MMSRMPDRSPVRRALLVLALLVPLVVDPFGADTQGAKALLLALCGGLLLILDGAAAWRGRPVPQPGAPEALLMLLAGWSAASLGWATNPALGGARVLLLGGMLGVARGLRAEVQGAESAARWLRGLLAAGALAVAVDTVLIVMARPELQDSTLKHASQLFVHNNMAASFVMALVPLGLAALLLSTGIARLALSLFLAGALSYLLLLGSRAGVLGAVLGMLVTGGLFLLRERLHGAAPPGRRMLLVAGALVLAAALLPLSESARGLAKDAYYTGVRLTGLDLGDTSFRPILWRKTLELSAEHPFGGVGAGNFPVVFPRFEHQKVAKPHAHNDALQVLAELGVPGLLLFLGLLATTALSLWGALRGGDRVRFGVAAGLLGLLLVLVVGGLFEVPFALGATALTYAFVIGLCGVLQPTSWAPLPPRRAIVAVICGALLTGLAAWRLPASYWMARAHAAAEAGRLDEAVAACDSAARLRTGAYNPEQLAGQLELQRGRPEAALEHARRALELAPWSSELLVDEGKALFALGRFAEAARTQEQALALTQVSEEAFLNLQIARFYSGEERLALDQLESQVRRQPDISLDFLQRLAELARIRAENLKEDDAELESALVGARHWYAVVAQEDPSRRPALDAQFRDLTHRLQVRPGAPDSWFKGTYRRWLAQGDWGIPGPALFIGLGPDDRMLYPGWALPPDGFPSGSWRQPSVWEDG
jgi:O-antigen ligase